MFLRRRSISEPGKASADELIKVIRGSSSQRYRGQINAGLSAGLIAHLFTSITCHRLVQVSAFHVTCIWAFTREIGRIPDSGNTGHADFNALSSDVKISRIKTKSLTSKSIVTPGLETFLKLLVVDL